MRLLLGMRAIDLLIRGHYYAHYVSDVLASSVGHDKCVCVIGHGVHVTVSLLFLATSCFNLLLHNLYSSGSQEFEKSLSLNNFASPVICFSLKSSSASIPMLRIIHASDIPLSTSSETMLLISSME